MRQFDWHPIFAESRLFWLGFFQLFFQTAQISRLGFGPIRSEESDFRQKMGLQEKKQEKLGNVRLLLASTIYPSIPKIHRRNITSTPLCFIWNGQKLIDFHKKDNWVWEVEDHASSRRIIQFVRAIVHQINNFRLTICPLDDITSYLYWELVEIIWNGCTYWCLGVEKITKPKKTCYFGLHPRWYLVRFFSYFTSESGTQSDSE